MFLGWKERYCSLAVETIPAVGPARRERGRILPSAALTTSCMAGQTPFCGVPSAKQRSGGQGELVPTEGDKPSLLTEVCGGWRWLPSVETLAGRQRDTLGMGRWPRVHHNTPKRTPLTTPFQPCLHPSPSCPTGLWPRLGAAALHSSRQR